MFDTSIRAVSGVSISDTMHELSITESILEIALRHAHQAGGPKITDIYLVIGQLSSVVDESVQFYWDFISEGSLAEGAKLHFRRIPAELSCRPCGRRFGPDEGLTCPNCGSSKIRVLAGDEFFMESIGVAEGPAEGPADKPEHVPAKVGSHGGESGPKEIG